SEPKEDPGARASERAANSWSPPFRRLDVSRLKAGLQLAPQKQEPRNGAIQVGSSGRGASRWSAARVDRGPFSGTGSGALSSAEEISIRSGSTCSLARPGISEFLHQ